jgi:hypothetical protein
VSIETTIRLQLGFAQDYDLMARMGWGYEWTDAVTPSLAAWAGGFSVLERFSITRSQPDNCRSNTSANPAGDEQHGS